MMNNINSFGGQFPGFCPPDGGFCPPGGITPPGNGFPCDGFPGGGFPAGPPAPNLPTQAYLDVVKNADTQGYYGQKDGVVTPDELFQYGDQLGQQLDFANMWKNQYGGGMGGFIDTIIQKLQNQWTATAVMLDNFGSFANNSGNGTGIAAQDVRATARRDGNARDVSGHDIQSGPQFPPDTGYPQPMPFEPGFNPGFGGPGFGGGFGGPMFPNAFGGPMPPNAFGGGFQQIA